VSEPEEEDFEKMFEASQQARRIEKGRTIEGTIVAIGEESALVDVGGKSEAEIDISELKDDEGDIEVAVGDRIQATVVSTAGGLKLSRKLALGAVSARQLEERRSSCRGQGRTRGEGRLRSANRAAARLLPGVADRHRQRH
jgi:small subunit ribosomal protein S1